MYMLAEIVDHKKEIYMDKLIRFDWAIKKIVFCEVETPRRGVSTA